MGIEISVTEFKAKCLDLIDKVSRREIDSISITKRGVPVVRVTAEESFKPTREQVLAEFREWQASMKGKIQILDPGFDLTQPIFDPADFDALNGRFFPDE